MRSHSTSTTHMLAEGDCVKLIGPRHTIASNSSSLSSSPLDGMNAIHNEGVITRLGTSENGGWYEIDCGDCLQFCRRDAVDLVTDGNAANLIRRQVSSMNQVQFVLTGKQRQRELARMRNTVCRAESAAASESAIALASSSEECPNVSPREPLTSKKPVPDTPGCITKNSQLPMEKPVNATTDVAVAHILVTAASAVTVREPKHRKSNPTKRDVVLSLPALITPATGCKRTTTVTQAASLSVNLPVERASKRVHRSPVTRETESAATVCHPSNLVDSFEPKPTDNHIPTNLMQGSFTHGPEKQEFGGNSNPRTLSNPCQLSAGAFYHAATATPTTGFDMHHLVTSPIPAFELPVDDFKSIQQHLEYLQRELMQVQTRLQYQQVLLNAAKARLSSSQRNLSDPLQIQFSPQQHACAAIGIPQQSPSLSTSSSSCSAHDASIPFHPHSCHPYQVFYQMPPNLASVTFPMQRQ